MVARISAVVCSHNQGHYLRAALASLVAQELALDQFEVIVVDNASRDGTKQICAGFAAAADLRCVLEPRLGLAYARNTGWQQARAEYVAYLDADAIASPQWLSRLLARFAGAPELAAVGGRIEPVWEGPRPDWFGANLSPFVGIIDWAPQAMLLRGDGMFLAGSNVAYTRGVLERLEGFRPTLGRRGRALLSNEEIMLQRQLLRAGLQMLYDPAIAVRHHVRLECLTRAWVRRRLYWQGVSDAILEYELAAAWGEAWSGPARVKAAFGELCSACAAYVHSAVHRAPNLVGRECAVCLAAGRLLRNARLALERTGAAAGRSRRPAARRAV